MALKRQLGIPDVFAVGAGAMISSGLFVLPAELFPSVGAALFLCYLAAAVLLLPSILTKGELMTAMPKAGGTFYYIDRSLGPGFGTVGGIAAWASLALKSAFAVLGIGLLAATVWDLPADGWQVKAIAVGFCGVFALLNALGAKVAGRAQLLLVAGLLIVLVGFVAGGMRAIDPSHYRPLLPASPSALLAGVGAVFIAFGGVTKIATLGEEVRNPKRDLLVGMFAAWAVVSILYVLVSSVTVGVLPQDGAQWEPVPLSQAAGIFWGAPGKVVLIVAAMLAFVTTGNAGVLSASRTVMAMSQDRLLPAGLARVSRSRGAPVSGILLTAVFMTLAVLLPLKLFIKAASAMKLMLFIFEMVALVLMRESRIPTYSPSWRCPFYPWPQVVGILVYGFLLVELGTGPLALAGLVLGGAAVWYVLYVRPNVRRGSALVHVAARVAEADFDEHDLEAELSRVVRERDQVLEDRFDRLIQECEILDLEGSPTRDEMFEAVGEHLARGLPLTVAETVKLLKHREDVSPTVIRPGLAIPHLIAEGLGAFRIVLARCRQGITFTEGQPPVRVVFVMAASPAERNFYLRALMAIAEIAQDSEFDGKWLQAGTVEALRGVVLAAERRRDEAHGQYDGTDAAE